MLQIAKYLIYYDTFLHIYFFQITNLKINNDNCDGISNWNT